MPRLDSSCIYDDSDEDCNKCVKHGYVWSCTGCEDYDDGWGRKNGKSSVRSSGCSADVVVGQ